MLNAEYKYLYWNIYICTGIYIFVLEYIYFYWNIYIFVLEYKYLYWNINICTGIYIDVLLLWATVEFPPLSFFHFNINTRRIGPA